MPSTPKLEARTIKCAAIATVGGESGLEVEAQGACGFEIAGRIFGGREATAPHVLKGTDAEGSRWEISSYAPEIRSDSMTGGTIFRLFPGMAKVTARRESSPVDDWIEIAFESFVRFPEASYSSRKNSYVAARDLGSYLGDDCEIFHSAIDGLRVAKVKRTADVDAFTQVERFVEAVSFLNGCQVYPLIAKANDGRRPVLWVFPRRSARNSRHRYPVADFVSQSGRKAAWQILASYYRFSILDRSKGKTRLSVCVSELHGAYNSMFVSGEALTALVAVEMLVDAFVKKSLVQRWPKSKVKKWNKWTKIQDIPQDVKKAFCEAAGYASKVGPVGLLRVLCKNDVLETEQVKAWREYRNGSAHGRARSIEEAIEALHCGINVFHAIALAITGYAGPFRVYLGDRVATQQAPGTTSCFYARRNPLKA